MKIKFFHLIFCLSTSYIGFSTEDDSDLYNEQEIQEEEDEDEKEVSEWNAQLHTLFPSFYSEGFPYFLLPMPSSESFNRRMQEPPQSLVLNPIINTLPTPKETRVFYDREDIGESDPISSRDVDGNCFQIENKQTRDICYINIIKNLGPSSHAPKKRFDRRPRTPRWNFVDGLKKKVRKKKNLEPTASNNNNSNNNNNSLITDANEHFNSLNDPIDLTQEEAHKDTSSNEISKKVDQAKKRLEFKKMGERLTEFLNTYYREEGRNSIQLEKEPMDLETQLMNIRIQLHTLLTANMGTPDRSLTERLKRQIGFINDFFKNNEQ